MDKRNIIIVILVLIILAGAVYYSAWSIHDTAFEKGYLQGINDGQVQLIQKINSDGQVPVISNNTIQYIPISTICSGGKA